MARPSILAEVTPVEDGLSRALRPARRRALLVCLQHLEQLLALVDDPVVVHAPRVAAYPFCPEQDELRRGVSLGPPEGYAFISYQKFPFRRPGLLEVQLLWLGKERVQRKLSLHSPRCEVSEH